VDTTTTDTLTCEIDWMCNCQINMEWLDKELWKVFRRLQQYIDDTSTTEKDTLVSVYYSLYKSNDTVYFGIVDTLKDELYCYLKRHRDRSDTAEVYICGVKRIRWIWIDTTEGEVDTMRDTMLLGLTFRSKFLTKDGKSSVAVEEIKQYAEENILDTLSLLKQACAHETGAQFNLYFHYYNYPDLCIMVAGPRWEAGGEMNVLIDSVFCEMCKDSLRSVNP